MYFEIQWHPHFWYSLTSYDRNYIRITKYNYTVAVVIQIHQSVVAPNNVSKMANLISLLSHTYSLYHIFVKIILILSLFSSTYEWSLSEESKSSN